MHTIVFHQTVIPIKKKDHKLKDSENVDQIIINYADSVGFVKPLLNAQMTALKKYASSDFFSLQKGYPPYARTTHVLSERRLFLKHDLAEQINKIAF